MMGAALQAIDSRSFGEPTAACTAEAGAGIPSDSITVSIALKYRSGPKFISIVFSRFALHSGARRLRREQVENRRCRSLRVSNHVKL